MEWDNIKIIVWAFLIILPFLWTDLLVHWPIPLRAVFMSPSLLPVFTLFGGLATW
jgi:hypothetical protein